MKNQTREEKWRLWLTEELQWIRVRPYDCPNCGPSTKGEMVAFSWKDALLSTRQVCPECLLIWDATQGGSVPFKDRHIPRTEGRRAKRRYGWYGTGRIWGRPEDDDRIREEED